MKTLEQARELAKSLVRVGNEMGVKTSAIITDMNQPLGRMIGNAVEIDESIDILKNNGPKDATELTLELGSRLLVAAGVQQDGAAARKELEHRISSGEASTKLEEMVKSHGGDLNRKREIAASHAVESKESGFVSRINAERLGLAVIEMGGGRKKLGDQIDHSSGIEFLVRIGDKIEKGQPLANVFCNSNSTQYAIELVGASVGVTDSEVPAPELIVESL